MNTKIILILTAIFLTTYVSAKPLIEAESSLKDQFDQFNESILHKLIKRAAVASESSSKTGFAGITVTKNAKSHKMTRKCEEYKQEPITKRWKCIKFLVVSKTK